jgi:CRP-like cAMP-binding protein
VLAGSRRQRGRSSLKFVRPTRDAFLQFLREHGEVAVRVAEELSRNYYTAHEEIRTLGLTNSPTEKFANLLLPWSSDSQGAGNGS